MKPKKANLLTNKLLGFEWDTNSFIENLNNNSNLKNLKPELVEKKDPPMIIKIKNIKERSLGICDENPIFEIELHIARKREEKLSSKLKKMKKKLTKNNR